VGKRDRDIGLNFFTRLDREDGRMRPVVRAAELDGRECGAALARGPGFTEELLLVASGRPNQVAAGA
jgi:hypothetical protein